jgi:hypothetical protein
MEFALTLALSRDGRGKWMMMDDRKSISIKG